MSEENQNGKVTSVEKSDNVKAKDPRKVELGKKLAKISKEAKERKARQQIEADREAGHERTRFSKEINDYLDFIPFRYLVGGVTIVAAIGGLYYAYKNDTRLAMRKRFEQNEQSERSKNASE